MLETEKLPEKVKDEFLFQMGGYKVFNNEKGILGISGKRLSQKELETVPQEIKEDVKKEVEKKVEEISKLPESEQKEAVEKLPEVVSEIVEKQLPKISINRKREITS